MFHVKHGRGALGHVAMAFAYLAIVVGLPACTDRTPNDVFVPLNRWEGDVPTGATIVSPEAFRDSVGSGETRIVSPATTASQVHDRERQRDEDLRFLSGLTTPTPSVAALLERAKRDDGSSAPTLSLADGSVVQLQDIDTTLHGVALAYGRATDPDNALDVYRTAYALLPAGLRSQAPDPAELEGATIDRLQQALTDLDTLLEGSALLEQAHLEAAPVGPAAHARAQVQAAGTPVPGRGTDEQAGCSPPTGLASKFWFPLKNFVSDVKAQGRRGTCWAFTAAAVLESRELVQHGTYVDLSEQYIVNRMKFDWFREDYDDGASTEAFLQAAVDRHEKIATEPYWTYNPAPNKPDTDTGKASDYRDACVGYTGTCSESSHESPMVCTYQGANAYCGFQHVSYATQPEVAASTTDQVWVNGSYFPLALIRLLLNGGHPLIASLPDYVGLDEANNGVVENYLHQTRDADGKLQPGARGDHAVMIVGFIGNDQLKAADEDTGGGGGYFIVRNSWGCAAGDGGYYYVAADYVEENFYRLSYLAFGTERSQAWKNEQAHGDEPPTIDVHSDPATVDLGVETDLLSLFRVDLPAATVLAREVRLDVFSSVDGRLYRGPHVIDHSENFGSPIPATFRTQGPRRLSVTVTYQTTSTSADFEVDVVNTPPTLSLHADGQAREGDPYDVTATVHDVNGDGRDALCDGTSWSVSAPDTVSPATGCLATVSFGIAGQRTIRAITTDAQGATTVADLVVDVQVPLDNPYPRITGGGLYALEFSEVGQLYLCGSKAVPNGSTIDIRDDDGCTILIGGETPPRYQADVSVENPENETLTFDWHLYIGTEGDTDPDFLHIDGTTETSVPVYTDASWGVVVTLPCRLAVHVNAPEPARDKDRVLWIGECVRWDPDAPR